MDILFMGTPEFAVPCLKAIFSSEHKIVAVVTQPDKPKGRGKKMSPPPVKLASEELGLNVLQPENIKSKDFIENLKRLSFDCIVVIAYGQILPKDILNLPNKGSINVHASLLPKYRGAAPINWAIINGEDKTGITTMYMEEGLDTGDMILKDEYEINTNMTAGNLHDELSVLGAKTLMRTLKLIEINKAPRIPQNNSESTYASMLEKSIGEIDWANDARSIHDKVRGLNPWPIAHTKYKDIIVKIWKSQVVDIDCSGENGEIVKVDKEGLWVCTGDKVLLLKEIQFPNNRKMTVEEYIRGNTLEEGSILGDKNV